MKVIIIGGLVGTGTTTVSKQVAESVGFEHVYAGGIFRQMAAEAGKTIEEYMIWLEGDPARERAVDDFLMERIQQGDAVIESRVAAWLAPREDGIFRAWLTCELDERLRRVGQREPDGRARAQAEERDERDAARYRSLYDIDIHDFAGSNDLVIDTTNIPADQVAAKILASLPQD